VLVTVAITLIIMGAVVRLFASVGQGLETRRATIEITNELRIARMLLAQDLANATALTLPPRDPKSAEGYLEIIEGIHTDWFPTNTIGNLSITSLAPTARLAGAETDAEEAFFENQLGNLMPRGGLGDFDDILAFTVRSQGEPYVAQMLSVYDGTTVTIKSQEAEVIWYAVEQPDGTRNIYRRLLLIAPWTHTPQEAVNNSNPPMLGYFNPQAPNSDAPDPVAAFFRSFNISARLERHPTSPNPNRMRWVPNTLADLTKRENRFAHSTDRLLHNPDPLSIFPYATDTRRIRPSDTPSLSPLVPAAEDIVATNVLACDLRVFDPSAKLFYYDPNNNGIQPGDVVVEPGDIGWHLRDRTSNDWKPAGQGAYVDLAYDLGMQDRNDVDQWIASPLEAMQTGYVALDASPQQTLTRAAFSVAPHIKSQSRVPNLALGVRGYYDTWSYHYEYDGIDQDGDNLIDEGTDGLDLDRNAVPGTNRGQIEHVHGVDDIAERETSPPDPVPLRGMEVRIRVYEPDTRQIREVSVKQNFTHQ